MQWFQCDSFKHQVYRWQFSAYHIILFQGTCSLPNWRKLCGSYCPSLRISVNVRWMAARTMCMRIICARESVTHPCTDKCAWWNKLLYPQNWPYSQNADSPWYKIYIHLHVQQNYVLIQKEYTFLYWTNNDHIFSIHNE